MEAEKEEKLTAHKPNPLNVTSIICEHTYNFFISSHATIIASLKNSFYIFHVLGAHSHSLYLSVCVCICRRLQLRRRKRCTACEIIIEHLLNWFQLFYPFNVTKRKKERKKAQLKLDNEKAHVTERKSRMKEPRG